MACLLVHLPGLCCSSVRLRSQPVVQTVRQPPITREITMGDVVLGAVGFVGAVMITAAIAGLLVGLVVVLMKRSRDRTAGPTDPGHSRLRV